MKNLIFVFLALFSFSLFAQETTEKTYALPTGKVLDMNLRFANTITVEAWDKAEVRVRTTIKTNIADFDEIYQFEVKDKAEVLRMTMDFEFKEKNSYWNSCAECEGDDLPDPKFCVCQEITYEITVPKNANLKLESVSADIEIKEGLQGSMQAKSISGFVDMTASNSAANQLSFKSVTGEIYTDFDIKLDEKSTSYSKKLNTDLNGGGPLLQLETISGNIFFRKM